MVTVTLVIIAVTTIVSLTALLSSDGEEIYRNLQLDKLALAAGEYWRLWTVTLLHGDFLHLAFNMYALYFMGTIVERWYGSIRFLVFYLTCAAAGSTASFVFGGDIPSVGASGAIFGLFGILLAAGRLHHPVDRQSRGIVNQLVVLIIINIVFGFASGGQIDNAAHLGGLAAGLWLGALVPPTKVPTLSSLWQRAGRIDGRRGRVDRAGLRLLPRDRGRRPGGRGRGRRRDEPARSGHPVRPAAGGGRLQLPEDDLGSGLADGATDRFERDHRRDAGREIDPEAGQERPVVRRAGTSRAGGPRRRRRPTTGRPSRRGSPAGGRP